MFNNVHCFRSINLALFALLIFAPPVSVAEDRVALVFGNAAYSHVGDLENTLNDARGIAQTLERKGFDVVLGLNQGHRDMIKRILEFESKISRASTALFYYAGHGVQVKGTNYLIPVDAQVESISLMSSETVSVDVVLDIMERSATKTNIIVLDACRNNPFPTGGRSLNRGLARITAPSGSIVAYATAPGQTAADGVAKNSPYTGNLLEVLEQPGLKIEEIFKEVRSRVASATAGEQVPWEESSLVGDFYFTPQSTPLIKSNAVVQPNGLDVPLIQELAYWDAVKNSGNVNMFREYLRKYPSGAFENVALHKIKDLESLAFSAKRVHGADFATLLKECEEHVQSNRLTNGDGGNAFACFNKVLDQNADNQTAIAGLKQIEEKYLGWANRAIERSQKTKATNYLEKIVLVNPDNQYISILQKKINDISLRQTSDNKTKNIADTLLQKRRKNSVNGYYKNE